MVPGVVNKSKKGFGKAKEVPRVETPRRMRFSEEEIDGNEAILFALEFIETYSVRPQLDHMLFPGEVNRNDKNLLGTNTSPLTHHARSLAV